MSILKTNTRKKIHYSKNKKRNWNKTDVKDVQEFIQDEINNEILGIDAQESHFEIDLGVSTKQTENEVTKKQKSFKIDLDNFKCFSNLKSHSKVKAPIIPAVPKQKRKPIKPNESFKKRLSQAKSDISKNALLKQKRQDFKIEGETFMDLWNSDKADEVDDEIVDEYNRLTKKKLPKVPLARRNMPTSFLPTIEAPHSGESYNPDPEKHQELLRKALEVEIKKETEEKKLRAKLSYLAVDKAPKQDDWIEEMTQGLPGFEKEEEQNIQEYDHEEETLIIKPPIRSENKKTKQKRRREREQKLFEKNIQQGKSLKRKENDIGRIKHYEKQLKKQEKKSLQLQKERSNKKLENLLTKTKRLGPVKFEEPEIAIKLTDELPSTLRQLKPEGNLMDDMYHSMLRRNVIEPRLRQKVPKVKRNRYFKKGHKFEDMED